MCFGFEANCSFKALTLWIGNVLASIQNRLQILMCLFCSLDVAPLNEILDHVLMYRITSSFAVGQRSNSNTAWVSLPEELQLSVYCTVAGGTVQANTADRSTS